MKRGWIAVVALSLWVSGPAFAAVPASGTVRPVVGTELWEGGSFVLREHVVVPAGATLTIRDVTVDFQVPELCSPIGGTLGYCQSDIQVLPGGRLVVERATILTTATVGRMYPTIVAFGDLSVTDSRFVKLGVLNVMGPGNGYVARNEFDHAGGEVSFWRDATGIAEDNWLHDGYAGIAAQDASPTLRNNVLERIDGIAIRVQQSLVGDKIFVTAPVVEGNVVRDSFEGLFSDAGSGFSIADNVFERLDYGVAVRVPFSDQMVQIAAPTVAGNRFLDVSSVLYAVSMTGPQGSTVVVPFAENSVEGTTCVFARAVSNANVHVQVDARGNWWGSADGPTPAAGCSGFAGDVLYDPWLAAPPA